MPAVTEAMTAGIPMIAAFQAILIGSVTAGFASLLTYFMSTIGQNNRVSKIVKDVCNTHIDIYHKDNIPSLIKESEKDIKKDIWVSVKNKTALQDQKIESQNDKISNILCIISKLDKSMDNLKSSQSFIIVKLDGNPKDFNL